ncbi:hypothetical protein [Noviherbaspirillum massiliense]|uniref:hypothetical protein n=1 Tax=Noviherbaspirillum massiliense TaxID=1465823 RepID=UPI0002E83A62|nr:hypothetical protein [Noviherbaspirillum massiliense]
MLSRFIQCARPVLLASALLLGGCGTLHKSATSLSEVDSGSVMVVGKIEMLPKIQAKDQDLKMGTVDPFNVKEAYRNRAMLFLSDQLTEAETTREAFNPQLEETYFFPIPKDKRYIVYGSVYTYYKLRTVNRYRSEVNTNEILLPVPIEFDIRPGDKAIYVGTWRFHRDEFNEVTKAELVDQYPAALAEFRKQFGANAELRKALARPARSSK